MVCAVRHRPGAVFRQVLHATLQIRPGNACCRAPCPLDPPEEGRSDRPAADHCTGASRVQGAGRHDGSARVARYPPYGGAMSPTNFRGSWHHIDRSPRSPLARSSAVRVAKTAWCLRTPPPSPPPAIVEEEEEACKVRDTDDDETAEATGQATSNRLSGSTAGGSRAEHGDECPRPMCRPRVVRGWSAVTHRRVLLWLAPERPDSANMSELVMCARGNSTKTATSRTSAREQKGCNRFASCDSCASHAADVFSCPGFLTRHQCS